MMIAESIRAHAQSHPEKTAVVFGARRLIWRQLHERSNRVANRLSKLWIARGDRVAVVSPNCLEYPEILYGALKAGAVPVPLPVDLPPDAVLKELLKADARAIFAGHSVLSLVSGFRKLCTRIVVEGREEGWLTYEGFLQAGTDLEPPAPPPGDSLAAAEAFSREFAVSADSISLIAAPMSGETTRRLCLATVLAGGSLILMRSFDPVDFSELVRREGCTHAVLRPDQIAAVSPNLTKNEITFVEFV